MLNLIYNCEGSLFSFDLAYCVILVFGSESHLLPIPYAPIFKYCHFSLL